MALVLAVGMIPAIPTTARADEVQANAVSTGGFTIDENGVLTEYTGSAVDVVIPEGVVTIGRSVFRRSEIQTVSFPSTLTTVEDSAFYGCDSISSIYLPDSVTNLGYAAFGSMDNLESIRIPASLEKTSSPFDHSGSNVEGGIQIEFGEGISAISASLFSGASGLKDVDIPSTVTQIGSAAFSDSSVQSITLPDGVELIDEFTFYDCSELTTVSTTAGASGPAGTVWPSALKEIGYRAFAYCDGVKDLVIPEGVTTVGQDAFAHIGGLESVSVPASLETAYGPFDGSGTDVEGGIRVSFADGMTSIPSSLFRGADGLKTIEIPTNITSIGTSVFASCSNLTDIFIPEETTTIASNAFNAAGGEGDASLLIHCYENSFAHQYAVANGIPYTFDYTHVHSFGSWSVYSEPTCEDPGLERRVCSCGAYEEQEYAEALGHSYGEWHETKPATYYEDGQERRDCSRCDAFEERTIDKLVPDLNQHPDYTVATMRIVDAQSIAAISGATIEVTNDEGASYSFNTGADGTAVFFAPAGTYHVLVTADGYQARAFDYEFSQGEMTLPDIAISTTSLVTGELRVDEMTYDEIVEAGIDTSNPDNQHVFKYEVTLVFADGVEPIEIPSLTYKNEKGEVLGGSFGGTAYTPGSGSYATYEIPDTHTKIVMVNEYLYIVIQGEARWLREMFHAQLIVVNSSNVDTMTNTTATINLPEGLSLAAMEGAAQSPTQDLGELASGETETVDWYIRGDVEGDYDISASLTTTFSPLGDTQTYTFVSENPIHVYAGSDMQLTVHLSDAAYYGEPYVMIFELENVSGHDIYNVTHQINNVSQYQVKKYTWIEDGRVVDTETEFNLLSSQDIGPEGSISKDVFKPGEKLVVLVSTDVLWESPLLRLKNTAQDVSTVLGLIAPYAGVPGIGVATAVSSMLAQINVRYHLVGAFTQTLEESTAEIPIVFDVQHRQGVSIVDEMLEDQIEDLYGDISDVVLGQFIDPTTMQAIDTIVSTIKGIHSHYKIENVKEGAYSLAWVVSQDDASPVIEISSEGATYDDQGRLVVQGNAELDVNALAEGSALLAIQDQDGNVTYKEFVVNEEVPGQDALLEAALDGGTQGIWGLAETLLPAGTLVNESFLDILDSGNMQLVYDGEQLSAGDPIPNGAVIKDVDSGAERAYLVMGDANSDARVDIFDAYASLLSSGSFNSVQAKSADLNGDGNVTNEDVVELLNYLTDESINSRSVLDDPLPGSSAVARNTSLQAEGEQYAYSIPLSELAEGYENVQGIQVDFLDVAQAGLINAGISNTAATYDFNSNAYSQKGDYARSVVASFDGAIDVSQGEIQITSDVDVENPTLSVRVRIQTADGGTVSELRQVTLDPVEVTEQPGGGDEPAVDPDDPDNPGSEDPEQPGGEDPSEGEEGEGEQPETPETPGSGEGDTPSDDPTDTPSEPSTPGTPEEPSVPGDDDGDSDVTVDFDASNGTVSISNDSAKPGDVVVIAPDPNDGQEVREVVVIDASGNIIEASLQADGTWTFTMPEGEVSIEVVFGCDGGSLCVTHGFTDVDATQWYHDPIDWAVSVGAMHGYADSTLFGPADGLLREQAATVMWNIMANGDLDAALSMHFDVFQSDWYAPYVNWAVQEGVMQGYSADDFGIGDVLTREQFAAIIANATGADVSQADTSVLSGFPDRSLVSDWAVQTMAWAVENGVINGYELEDGTLELQANRTITRAEMAAMLMNAVEEGVMPL